MPENDPTADGERIEALELRRFKMLIDELSGDIMKAMQEFSAGTKSQYHRRGLFRTAFAVAEGLTSAMKRYALGWDVKWPGILSKEELSALREDDYSVRDNGTVMWRRKGIPLSGNFRLAIRTLLKTHNIEESDVVDYTDDGWDCFRKSVERRNRVVHPQAPEDLEVSDEDVQSLTKAIRWILVTHDNVYGSLREAVVFSLGYDPEKVLGRRYSKIKPRKPD